MIFPTDVRDSATRPIDHIVISGWYGHGNIGDEAILNALLDICRTSYPGARLTILSHRPQHTHAVHGVEAVWQLPYGSKGYAKSLLKGRLHKTVRALSNCDLFIMGGGGFLSDWQVEAPLVWLHQFKLAKFFHKRTLLFGIGAGPFFTDAGRNTTREYINRLVDNVVVRDHPSQQALVRIAGVDEAKVSVAVDLVACHSPNPGLLANAAPESPVTIVPCRYFHHNLFSLERRLDEKRLYLCYERMVETLLERGKNVRLVFFQKGAEEDFCDQFKAVFGDRVDYALPEDHRVGMDLIMESCGVISFRLHGSIMAFAGRRPFLPIIYHHKTRGFLDMTTFDHEDLVLYAGDGMQMRHEPLEPSVWSEKANAFVDLISAGKYRQPVLKMEASHAELLQCLVERG